MPAKKSMYMEDGWFPYDHPDDIPFSVLESMNVGFRPKNHQRREVNDEVGCPLGKRYRVGISNENSRGLLIEHVV